MRAPFLLVLVLSALGLAGCGTNVDSEFPHRLVGAQGQVIVLEDIETIVNDGSLTADEKRTRLHDLGLLDEKLIDSLLRS